jgi:hypothetical protein
MVEPTQFRRGPDRRRQPRGGRRAGDIDGFSPLVLLVGEDHNIVQQAEGILCRLKFAVSATTDPEEALRILPGLRPNLVVVAPRHELLLRTASPVPVIVIGEDFDAMIDEIRRALRVTPIDRSAQMR